MKRFFILYIINIGIVANLHAQDTLALSNAIQIGLENNFNIKISEGQKDIASNNNTLGNAGFLPTFDLTAAQRYTVENTTQQFISGDTQNRDGAKSNNFSAGAVLNWTIFDGTTMFYTKDRLEELEKQGIAINESMIQNIVAQIGKEFYTVALEQIRLELLFQNISLSEDRMEIAKNKYEFGKASKMEYLQAQVDLNNDISNHMIQQERLAASKTALNELLGRDVTLDFYADFDPDLNTSLQYEALKAAMETSNPELLAATYQLNASELAEKELFGQRMPEIGLNMGYNFAKSEAEAGFLLSRQSSGLTYGLSASWNLFNGLNLNRQIQNARIVAENTALNYEAIKTKPGARVVFDLYQVSEQHPTAGTWRRQIREVARENNEIAIERYSVGNSSPLELREAQINLLEANLEISQCSLRDKDR
jgi:outer membrane protein